MDELKSGYVQVDPRSGSQGFPAPRPYNGGLYYGAPITVLGANNTVDGRSSAGISVRDKVAAEILNTLIATGAGSTSTIEGMVEEAFQFADAFVLRAQQP